MKQHRIERINQFILEEVTKIVRDKVSHPEVSPWLSITKVETSKDLSISKIYVSVMEKEMEKKEATIKALNHSSGYIHFELRKILKTKRVPQLKFFLDLTQDNVDRINQLLNKLHQENNPDE